MAYSRFFMPLVQEAKGYEFKGRLPAGRCIVEARSNTGKLFMWVQDLMPETMYSIYLVFPQGQHYTGLHMGQLDVDEKGRAEFRREIVDIHTFALNELVAVAITATNATGVVSPLCGYRDAQVSWRHSFRIWENEMPETMGNKEEEPGPAAIEPLAPAIIEPPVIEEVSEPVTDELPIVPPRATRPQSVSIPAHVSSPEVVALSQSRIDTVQLLESIFNANTLFEPFLEQDREMKWVRCNLAEQMPIPNECPHLLTEPFIQTAWADYEHFVLGITTDGEPMQYAIGIPSSYSPEDEVIARNLGFVQFIDHDCDSQYTEYSGYWLMFVDF